MGYRFSPVTVNNTTIYKDPPGDYIVGINPQSPCYINTIHMDMEGWDNGLHPDVPPRDKNIYPYAVTAYDQAGERHIFYTPNRKSSAMHDMLSYLREEWGLLVHEKTFVEVVAPPDQLSTYGTDMEFSFGALSKIYVRDLNARGFGAFEVAFTRNGKAKQRLECLFDEVCHHYVTDVRMQGYRPAERVVRFEGSVHNCYDYDMQENRRRNMYLESIGPTAPPNIPEGALIPRAFARQVPNAEPNSYFYR